MSMSRILSPGTMTILILAILVGLVAAYGIRGALGPRTPVTPETPQIREPGLQKPPVDALV